MFHAFDLLDCGPRPLDHRAALSPREPVSLFDWLLGLSLAVISDSRRQSSSRALLFPGALARPGFRVARSRPGRWPRAWNAHGCVARTCHVANRHESTLCRTFSAQERDARRDWRCGLDRPLASVARRDLGPSLATM